VIYIVLGVLYESLAHPLTIISTLPPAGLGALIALNLTGSELNLIAFVGIILLIGIVKKNGIMLVDFALDAERKRGLAPEQAIFQASLERLRPILMTTLAALFGRYAARDHERGGRRTATAARNRHYWWPACVTGSHLIHNTRNLSASGEASPKSAFEGSRGRARRP
jgi:hypothetical protein